MLAVPDTVFAHNLTVVPEIFDINVVKVPPVTTLFTLLTATVAPI
jgi:hypothetical protein